MTAIKTPGQIAYEADLSVYPNYHDGAPRKPWEQLSEHCRYSWERNPTITPLAKAEGK